MRERDRLASGRGVRGLFPDMFEYLRDLKLIGDEGDDPHRLSHLLILKKRIGLVDLAPRLVYG